MNDLTGKKYCILGRHGFIGSALEKEIVLRGGVVTSTPEKGQTAIFNFASPTHIPFEKNPDYFIKETLDSFTYLLPFCRDNKVLLVWASSALVYEKKDRFTSLKKAIEELQVAYSTPALCLRVFPVYGTGEGSRPFPTAIYQWCQTMKKGDRPVVFGNGKQKRDFIFIDDLVDNILGLVQKHTVGIIDVGPGKPISFNQIIKEINSVLETNIEPLYIPAPDGYSGGIVCSVPVKTSVSLAEGIRRILNEC